MVSSAGSAPAYAYALNAVKTLPPVRPSVQLNAGANYVEHEQGIAQQQGAAGGAGAARGGAPAPPATSAPGIWERRAGDTRDNPYLFQKSPTVVIGNNEYIVVPRGRTNIDFECEFAVVIGKRAKYVPLANANEYIFGYTAHHDVSDRGGRGDRKMGGSDWLIGKNHDTFGPLGPFIVPKEFVKDPMNTTPRVDAQRPGDAGLEHQPDEPQHSRAGAVRVEHPDAECGRHHRRRQPGGDEHRARRPALDAAWRYREV